MAGLSTLSKNYACPSPDFCIKNTGRDVRDGDGGNETSAPAQDLGINNFTLEDFNEYISLLFPFLAPIHFKPVLEYRFACLIYAREFYDTALTRQHYVFEQTLSYYVLLHCYIYIYDQKIRY